MQRNVRENTQNTQAYVDIWRTTFDPPGNRVHLTTGAFIPLAVKARRDHSARGRLRTATMKQLLIVKCGAAGDVVRTTPLLRAYSDWKIDWFTAPESHELVPEAHVRAVFTQLEALDPSNTYDLVISLEDDPTFLKAIESRIRCHRRFGALANNGTPTYTYDSSVWFDMGMISRYGIREADRLKLVNRSSYQELIFRGLGLVFQGERYILPQDLPSSELQGDIAVAPKAGARWPSKNWAFFDELIARLSADYSVNVLPMRESIREHIADIKNHRFIITGDSLPMHLALGLGLRGVALFTCTSPWEIYDYGILRKIVSPSLENFFYYKDYHATATTSLRFDDVHQIVLEELQSI